VTEGIEAVLAEVFAALRPHLNERQRRLVLGAAARALGRGGIRSVASVTGAAESTVSRGVRALESGAEPSARVRGVGRAASGCGMAIPGWWTRCSPWSSRISAVTRNRRCGGR